MFVWGGGCVNSYDSLFLGPTIICNSGTSLVMEIGVPHNPHPHYRGILNLEDTSVIQYRTIYTEHRMVSL